MKKCVYKQLILLLIILLQQSVVNAQISSIEQEIKQHLTYDELVLKARDLLLHSMQENNLRKSEELLSYLNQKFDSSYAKEPITFSEKILVQLYIGQLKQLATSKIFTEPTLPDPNEFRFYYGRVDLAYADQLARQLVVLLKQKKTTVENAIQEQADLSSEEKDFLKLLFKHYTSDFPHRSSEEVNQQADNFLFFYPNSKYHDFIRTTIRKVYELSKWGLNYEVSAGYMEGTEFIGSTFQPGFAFGFGAGLSYKHFLFKLDVHLGITSPTRDIRLRDTVWEKGHSSNITQFSTSVGYMIAPYKKVSLIPELGIGTTSITPSQGTEENQERYDGVGYKAKITYYAGLGLKFQLHEYPRVFGTSTSYLMLKYRFSEPKLDQGYQGVNGQVHLVTLCYGGFYRNNIRLK